MGSTRRDALKIALLLPRAGPIGMWAPSSEKCAQLAIAELNSLGGIGGRRVVYDTVDASGDPLRVAAETSHLVRQGGAEAVVGMHTSDIRTAVKGALRSQVPYIFAPMYEGGEASRGVFLMGETPERQFAPMIRWMMRELGCCRWYLIGNTYNYPYVSNQRAKHFIAESGGGVVGENYVAMDNDDFDAAIATIAASQANAVLVNLVGSSAVHFHRAFMRAGLPDRIKRFCGVLEENTLLAIGPEGNTGMFTATGYFEGLATNSARDFKRRYQAHFGLISPVLNQFAISCYEGIYLLAAITRAAGSLDVDRIEAANLRELNVPGPRGALELRNRHARAAVHLTRVDSLNLSLMCSTEA